jgi:diketogulonate reductase-like aldo/keto reductase
MAVANTATLYTGAKIPMVGYGMWKVGKDVVPEMVVNLVGAGYRLIDNACDYGNEKEVGEGLKKVFEAGTVKREDLWITSKLWNTYHRKEHVKAACQKTLSDLGLEYLDLYLIHFPISLKFVPFETRYPPEWFHDPSAANPKMEEDPVSIRETWEAMEELVDAGLVKNIGVANFNTGILRDLLSYCRIKPAVNQVELHPYLAQEKLIRFCKANDIHVTAFSSFGGSSYVELGGAVASDLVFTEKLVQDIAAKYKKTPAQIALVWAVQRGTSVIPKTSNPQRLKENIDVFDITLTDEEMKSISALNKNKRFNDPGNFCEGAFNTFFPIYE